MEIVKEYMRAEEKFFQVMKRIRKLGLDTYPLEGVTVSLAQMALLDQIAASPGCSVTDIANGLHLASPTVSVGVRKMEESNLVERKPDHQDGRSVEFFLTPDGKILQQKIHFSMLQKFGRLLAGLNSQEQDSLLQLLDKALQIAEVDNQTPVN